MLAPYSGYRSFNVPSGPILRIGPDGAAYFRFTLVFRGNLSLEPPTMML
jgi:hypothetical protein